VTDTRRNTCRFVNGWVAAICLALLGAAPADHESRHNLVRVEGTRGAVRAGKIVVVRVTIRGGEGVSSVPFTLLYDPAVLEFLPAASRQGRFMKRGGAATTFLAVQGAAPGGRTGVVVGLSRMGTRQGVSGRGVLCELAFRARAPGLSVLSFTRSAVLDPRAVPQPARFEGGSIRVRSSP